MRGLGLIAVGLVRAVLIEVGGQVVLVFCRGLVVCGLACVGGAVLGVVTLGIVLLVDGVVFVLVLGEVERLFCFGLLVDGGVRLGGLIAVVDRRALLRLFACLYVFVPNAGLFGCTLVAHGRSISQTRRYGSAHRFHRTIINP